MGMRYNRKKGFIPIAQPNFGVEELIFVTDALKSGWVSSQGKYIDEFEKSFARFCGTRYAVSVANGTAALHLALLSLGIKPGDEVIVPTLTFIATVNAVKYVGAKPVFADSEKSNWCIDPQEIEKKITRRTRAIIIVHLYGHPADMDPILKIAHKYNLYVIEDAAEAHGAEYKGRKVGSIGGIGVFSFYGNKIITTGEGGMLVSNNKDIARKARLFKNHGMGHKKKYWHKVIGYNYRMTNLQAALGLAQLRKIKRSITRKREVAASYSHALSNIKGITLPKEAPWAKSVFWMYCILVEDNFGITKNALMQRLKTSAIETRPIFYPIHKMPPYRNKRRFPVAEALSQKGICLPSSVTLKKDDIERIVRVITRNYV